LVDGSPAAVAGQGADGQGEASRDLDSSRQLSEWIRKLVESYPGSSGDDWKYECMACMWPGWLG
jgi:hypothetical protein